MARIKVLNHFFIFYFDWHFCSQPVITQNNFMSICREYNINCTFRNMG